MPLGDALRGLSPVVEVYELHAVLVVDLATDTDSTPGDGEGVAVAAANRASLGKGAAQGFEVGHRHAEVDRPGAVRRHHDPRPVRGAGTPVFD